MRNSVTKTLREIYDEHYAHGTFVVEDGLYYLLSCSESYEEFCLLLISHGAPPGEFPSKNLWEACNGPHENAHLRFLLNAYPLTSERWLPDSRRFPE